MQPDHPTAAIDNQYRTDGNNLKLRLYPVQVNQVPNIAHRPNQSRPVPSSGVKNKLLDTNGGYNPSHPRCFAHVTDCLRQPALFVSWTAWTGQLSSHTRTIQQHILIHLRHQAPTITRKIPPNLRPGRGNGAKLKKTGNQGNRMSTGTAVAQIPTLPQRWHAS